MNGLLALLDDAYLQEIADHFASLDLPYPPPLAPVDSAAQREAGEALVRRGDATRGLPACNDCHGAQMTGLAPFVPGLLGLPRDYLNAQLGAWRSGQRRALAPDCMAQVAQRLSPEEIGAVSAWLAAQPVPAHATAPAAPPTPLPIACGGAASGPTR
jgi:cytochrome c553